MSFLSPWFLIGLLGVSAPILLHLIRREKAVRIPFSTLRFLRKARKRMIWFQKMQQLLLMLLRAAIIAILALAFARPYLQGMFSVLTGLSPQSMVILLDTSLSMQYEDAFDRARDEALSVIGSLQPGDEIAVAAFDEGVGRVLDFTDDTEVAETFVRSLESPGYRRTRYLPALHLADQILTAARHEDKRVCLISDYRRQGFEGLDPAWRLSPGVTFESRNIGDEQAANLAVTDVKAPAQLIRDGEEHVVLARVRNLGNRQEDEAEVSLILNDETVATQTVDLSDKSEAVVEFRAVFGARGFWRGAVEVQDRAFPADNRFYFTVNVAPPVRVLCINGETGANWYEDESYWFRLALGQQEGSPFRLDVQRPEQVNAADLSRYQVVAMLNVDRVNEALQKALPDFVDNGGSLLLAPADRVERNAFNSTFGDVTPGLLTTAETEPEGEYLVLADINNRHAIVQPLRSSERSDFGAAHFQSHWAADTTQGSTVVLGFDNGDPALMARTIGKGRVALFTSSLDTEWNNLPLQVLYLPLLHETMRYLTMSEERKRSYIIGEPVPMPPGKQFQVRTPVGDEETLEADAEERTFYTRLDLPGWYDFDAGDSREYIAANVAREESDLSSIEPEEFRNAVQNPVTEPEESLEVRTAAVQMQIEQSQQLWWWLLALALALGIGETILANRTYR